MRRMSAKQYRAGHIFGLRDESEGRLVLKRHGSWRAMLMLNDRGQMLSCNFPHISKTGRDIAVNDAKNLGSAKPALRSTIEMRAEQAHDRQHFLNSAFDRLARCRINANLILRDRIIHRHLPPMDLQMVPTRLHLSTSPHHRLLLRRTLLEPRRATS